MAFEEYAVLLTATVEHAGLSAKTQPASKRKRCSTQCISDVNTYARGKGLSATSPSGSG